jgi:plasmid stabilization system protein ParE
MKIELHPEARVEFLDSVAHYNSIQPALGARFIESVRIAMDSIKESPELWTEIEQNIRRKLTRVFPYALLYTIEPDYILVVAVMHCRQRPGYWRTRIANNE